MAEYSQFAPFMGEQQNIWKTTNGELFGRQNQGPWKVVELLCIV